MSLQQILVAAIQHNPRFSAAYCTLGGCISGAETVTLANGRVMTKRQLFVAAIEHDPSCSEAYCNLGACLAAHETVKLADGRVMTKRQLFVAAIQHKPSCSEAYYNLGPCLAADETVTLADGRVMTQRQLFVAAIQHNPSCFEAYRALGTCLCADETVTLADGRVMAQRQLFVAAIQHNPKYSAAYCNLGASLSDTETVRLADGRTMTKRQLFVATIEHNSSCSEAYSDLGARLCADETVTLAGGRTMTKRQLFVAAIQHGPSCFAAYCNLGACLCPDETVTLADGRTMTKRQLFVAAIQHKPSCSEAYYSLGACLGADEEVKLADGRVMTRRQLFVAAIEHDPRHSTAYCTLGTCLCADEEVKLADGRVMTRRQLFVTAIKINPKNSFAYYNLGVSLFADETVTLADGRVMTKRQLYVAAIEHDSRYSRAFNNLGSCLDDDDETVTLADGGVMTKRQLFVAAIEFDAKNATAYYNLSQTIPSAASIPVAGGRALTREACLLEAYRLDPDAAIGEVAANRLRRSRLTFSVPDTPAKPMTADFTLLDTCDAVLDQLGLVAPDSHITLRGVGFRLVRGKKLADCGFVEGAYEVEVARGTTLSFVADVVISTADLHLLESVSRGGFGEVWKARYNGRIVAVKKPLVHTPGVDASLRRELSIITSIPPHRNIIEFIGRVTHQEHHPDWVVLEYADRNLSQATSLQRNEAFIVSIAKQLCSALQHLHARRVYHLDLKPDNVLIVGDVAKLCDFGLSRLYEPDTASGPISKEMGTPNFGAPEQFDAGVGTLSAHSDVYGLGATLWASVTGEAPWSGLSLAQIVTQMVLQSPCPAPLTAHPDCGCTPQLNSLIEWCMKLSPAERPKLDQVAAALDAMP